MASTKASSTTMFPIEASPKQRAAGPPDDKKSPMTTTTMTTWLTMATSEIKRLDLNPELVDVLRSFGADDAPGPANLDPDDMVDDTGTEWAGSRGIEGSSEDGATAAASASSTPVSIPQLISTKLTTEIDADQATMFARRFTSVSSLLQSTEFASSTSSASPTSSTSPNSPTSPTSNLLRLALHRRALQILSAPNDASKPKALRIRALVDFVWSQALILGNVEGRSHLPTLVELITGNGDANDNADGGEGKGGEGDALQYEEIAPGIHHATLTAHTSDYGPVHTNILRISSHALAHPTHTIRMQCLDTRTIINKRTGELGCTDLSELARQEGAVAAVSGGFFLYSEPDIVEPSCRTDPVGLLVTNNTDSIADAKGGEAGTVVNPPVFRRAALLQDGKTGEIRIERLGMGGVAVRIGGEESGDNSGEKSGGNSGEMTKLEVMVGKDGVRCVHRGDTKTTTLKCDEVGISIVGTKVFRVSAVTGGESDGTSIIRRMDVPLAGFVLVIPSTLVETNVLATIQEGTPVSYQLPTTDARPNNISAAMAGGPILLSADHDADDALDLAAEDFRGSAPPVTFSQDETFDRNLLPRMGAGVTADGELVLAAIDGRNLERALGLTLRGTANLLAALGCVRAMNLDGGSSKRMVIRHKVHGHRVVCLSTTEIKANQKPDEEGGAGGREDDDEENVEEVEEVGEDMQKHDEEKDDERKKKEKAELTPELSRPVHSAILFLPRK